MPDRKKTFDELVREHPERFDYGDIEPDERRDSPGMKARVGDGLKRLRGGKK